MKFARAVTTTVAVLLVMGALTEARAAIVLNFSGFLGSEIVFTGDGTKATFSLSPGVTNALNPDGDQWWITTRSDGTPESAVGFFGSISKTFSYNLADVVVNGTKQTATPVTTNGGPSVLSINDGAGFEFTANLQWHMIQSDMATGSLNVNAWLNLTNIAYGGSNDDLQKLVTESAAFGGVTTLTFQFTGNKSLTDLVGAVPGPTTNSTSYSGSITAGGPENIPPIPEPTSLAIWGLGMGALGFVGYRRSRKRAAV